MSDLQWTPVKIKLGQIQPWTNKAICMGVHGIIRTNNLLVPAMLEASGDVTNTHWRRIDMFSITKVCVKCGIEKSALSFPFQKNKCKQCYKEEYIQKHSREYVCQNCGNTFISYKGSATRKPKYCSRACAGFKKGIVPWNAGTAIKYDKCSVCGKPKTTNRERDYDRCQTCRNKSRAVNTVYYSCPRCGKPKNGRGRSDRIFCNSCAAIYRHQKLGHIIKPYYIGFTAELKKKIRNHYNNQCAQAIQ